MPSKKRGNNSFLWRCTICAVLVVTHPFREESRPDNTLSSTQLLLANDSVVTFIAAIFNSIKIAYLTVQQLGLLKMIDISESSPIQ